MEKGPKLKKCVLQGRPRQQQSSLSVETDQCLPPLALEVLDVLGFVENEVIPTLALECEGVLDGQLVRCNHNMIHIRLSPPRPQLFSALGRTIVA